MTAPEGNAPLTVQGLVGMLSKHRPVPYGAEPLHAWRWATSPPSTSALVMPRIHCPVDPLVVAISLIGQLLEVLASHSWSSAQSG